MFEERTFLNVFTPKKITASEALYMKFAVIDTDTTWTDEVMSIGIVIADGDTKKELNSKYYIISPEYKTGGMFSATIADALKEKTLVMTRSGAIEDIRKHTMPSMMPSMNLELWNCWGMILKCIK